jgi:hypothetical protein
MRATSQAPVGFELRAMLADLEALEGDAELLDEGSFARRADAIDRLGFFLEGPAGAGQPSRGSAATAAQLTARAVVLRQRLEDVDKHLFRRLRADLRSGACRGPALRATIGLYTGPPDGEQPRRSGEPGFDSLDDFVHGLLLGKQAPRATRDLEPDMVPYQPTPARIILELADQAHLAPGDLLVDIGSGLGLVPILMHLLTGAHALGVEVEPAYVDYARDRAADLDLADLRFVCSDARQADYAEGAVFFLYTPFGGRMLDEVLDRLRAASSDRPIRLFTYGPCTPHVARRAWLECVGGGGQEVLRLAEFRVR